MGTFYTYCQIKHIFDKTEHGKSVCNLDQTIGVQEKNKRRKKLTRKLTDYLGMGGLKHISVCNSGQP